MKAAVLERFGKDSAFTIRDLPRPSIRTGQILVRNYASSVNPVDTIMRRGKMALASIGLNNQVIGSDFCGIVLASKSRRFKEGDAVFGLIPAIQGGAYAEEIVVNEQWAAGKPANLTDIEAGVIPLVGLTAYQGLTDVGQLQTGEQVLITGCTGGVGTAAVRIAGSRQAHITGLCSGEHKEFALANGCNAVLDYQTEKLPLNSRFDLIFDAAGKYTLSELELHLREHAYFVTTRGDTGSFKGAVKTATDIVFEKRMKFVMVKSNAADLEELRSLAERNILKLPVAETFSLEDLDAAHQKMEEGGFIGKIAVRID